MGRMVASPQGDVRVMDLLQRQGRLCSSGNHGSFIDISPFSAVSPPSIGKMPTIVLQAEQMMNIPLFADRSSDEFMSYLDFFFRLGKIVDSNGGKLDE